MSEFAARPLITFSDEPETANDTELPQEQQVKMQTFHSDTMPVNHDKVTLSGVTYQRCGGGRRVIRRQKGSY